MPSLTDVMRRFRKEEIARELISVGVFAKGGSLYLCREGDETKARTVKVITIPYDVFARYDKAHAEWSKVQMILDGFPQTLRPRKKAKRKPRVEIPDLTDEWPAGWPKFRIVNPDTQRCDCCHSLVIDCTCPTDVMCVHCDMNPEDAKAMLPISPAECEFSADGKHEWRVREPA